MATVYRTPFQDSALYLLEAMRAQAETQQEQAELFLNVTQRPEELERGILTCKINPRINHHPSDWTPCVLAVEGTEERGRPRILLSIPAEVRPGNEGDFIFRPPTLGGVMRLPAIPTDLLAQKSVDRTNVILGPIEEADRWIQTRRAEFLDAVKSSDWPAWWRLSLGLAAATMKCDTNVLTALEQKLGPNSRVAVKTYESIECPVMLRPLNQVLRTAATLAEPPELLVEWLTASPAAVNSGNILEQIDRAKKHTAIMDNYDAEGNRNSFPLDASQRESLLHGLGGHRITPIQGPPGTGKTALIRAYAATMMVNAALEENHRPPFILATGSTNVAVTNIIQDFTGAAKPLDIGPDGKPAVDQAGLTSRWIPEAKSFGWFQPARSHLEKLRRADGVKIEEANAGAVELANFPILDHGLSEAERLAGKTSVDDDGLAFRLDTFGTAAGLTPLLGGKQSLFSLVSAAALWIRCHNAALGKEGKDLIRSEDAAIEAIKRITAIQKSLKSSLQENVISQNSVNNTFRRHLMDPTAETLALVDEALNNTIYKFSKTCTSSLLLDKSMEKTGSALTRMVRHKRNEKERAKATQEAFDAIQEVLDQGPRLDAFHIAARFWEAEFLITRMRRASNPSAHAKAMLSLAKSKGPGAAIRENMRDVLSLGPVVVSTIYALPNIFKFRDIQEAGYGIADSLIVDEASQCQPDIIAPAFAYAQKAEVIGDMEQLDPVVKITPKHDEEMLRAVIGGGKRTIHQDLLVSTGNAMMTALRSSPIKHLMLRGHYRCVPEIMRYFSHLSYKGALHAMRAPRTDSENFHFAPPVGYHAVPSEARRVASGSMDNRAEAKAIADYLARNADLIEELFQMPIEKAVGVLSAYQPQRSVLKSEIKKAFGARSKLLAVNIEDGNSEALKLAGDNFTFTKRYGARPDITREMTIGTVHQFQGGQRQMLILSLVADGRSSSTSPNFLDRTNKLLNVATSRAKDSIVVFTTPEMLSLDQQSGVTPTNLMMTWLKTGGISVGMPEPLTPPSIDTVKLREKETSQFQRAARITSDISALLPSSLSPEAQAVEDLLDYVAAEAQTMEAIVEEISVALPADIAAREAFLSNRPADDWGLHNAPPDLGEIPLAAYDEDISLIEGPDSRFERELVPGITEEEAAAVPTFEELPPAEPQASFEPTW